MKLYNTTHPYIERKQIKPIGLRQDKQKQCLAIPMYDVSGELQNIQFIYADGTKRFFKGAKKKGCFHIIGNLKKEGIAYFVEGFATGVSVHMATGKPVIVAFDAGNLEPVIAAIKQKYPYITHIIAADNDCWGGHNIGKEKAEEAAKKHGCNVILPEFSYTIKKAKPTDWNDLHVLAGLDEVRRQLMGACHD